MSGNNPTLEDLLRVVREQGEGAIAAMTEDNRDRVNAALGRAGKRVPREVLRWGPY